MRDDAVLITGHYAKSRRRASIHEIGDALWRRGFAVSFVTVGYSPLSRLVRDVRLKEVPKDEIRRVVEFAPRRRSFVWRTWWHPANLRIGPANALAAALYRRYGEFDLGPAEELVRRASLVIIESGAGLLLAERVRRINPGCRLIYRVSDDVRVLKCHAAICEAERTGAQIFDLVSAASPLLAADLPEGTRRAVHPHGFNGVPLREASSSPYAATRRKNAVSVGTMLFDPALVLEAARLFPDVDFHVIGSTRLRGRSNVVTHGEMKYGDMLPYVKFADVGLAPYRLGPGMDYLAHTSNKILLYTAARLPVVAPLRLVRGREHVFGYDGSKESIKRAVGGALAYERARIGAADRTDWDCMVANLLADAGYSGEDRAAAGEN